MLNRASLIGNVGQDPEIKSTGDGREIALLSLATSESWKDKKTGEKKEITDWFKIVIYQPNLINLCRNYIKKGSKLYVEGKIKTRSYEKNGVKHYITEIILDFDGKILLIDSKQAEPARAFSEPKEPENNFNNNLGDEDCPF